MMLAPHTHAVRWEATGNGETPYRAFVDGQEWLVQVNDFPAAPLYTLLVEGVAVARLEAWPASWMRPPQSL